MLMNILASIFPAAMLLFLVMDPLGNIPTFIGLLKDVDPRRRRWIILRENIFAYIILVVFLWAGRFLLEAFQIDKPALGIAGGITLFLIAVRMIFPVKEGLFGETPDGEPFMVPLAIPLISGPSSMATVMLLASREPERMVDWMVALTCAWLVSLGLLLLCDPISRLLGERGLVGLTRLMGMLLTAVAVQMFLNGLRLFMRGG
jgi:multiple antibiotic resistance protein